MQPMLGLMAGAGVRIEVFTLSGINGSPIILTDLVGAPSVSEAYWEFQTDGELWAFRQNQSDFQRADGVEFTNYQPGAGADLWIKATQTGVTDPGDPPNIGDALDTWWKVRGSGAANRSWGGNVTSAQIAGTVRIDLSTDASGTPIVATGYYRFDAESIT